MNKSEVWLAPYGVYDCLLNVAVYWLDIHGLKPDTLFKYNWDLHYSPEHDEFGGSISKVTLKEFLTEYYSIKCTDYSNLNVQDEIWFIIGLDTFYLPYIKPFYRSVHQLHFLLCKKTMNTYKIFDPYYLETLEVPSCDINVWWNRYKRPLILLGPQRNNIVRPIRPFIASQPYEIVYEEVKGKIASQLLDIFENYEENEYRYKKYFGLFYSLFQARERYFENCEEKEFQSEILRGWGNVLKSMIRLDDNKLLNDLDLVFEYEVLHIKEISQKEMD